MPLSRVKEGVALLYPCQNAPRLLCRDASVRCRGIKEWWRYGESSWGGVWSFSGCGGPPVGQGGGSGFGVIEGRDVPGGKKKKEKKQKKSKKKEQVLGQVLDRRCFGVCR